MEDFITRKEHEEFSERMKSENKRLEDENDRQNHRIAALEDNARQFTMLAGSVEKLAVNMESMLKELEKQGKRIDTIEGRDGDMWRKVTGHVITTVLGIALGYFFTHMGM